MIGEITGADLFEVETVENYPYNYKACTDVALKEKNQNARPELKKYLSDIRNYDEASCRRIEFVKCMRNAGVEIEILIEYMVLFEQGKNTVEARKKLLE